MRHHNKAGDQAMDDLLRLISHYFPQPSGMKQTVEFAQVGQGELLREAIEHWRRRKFRTSGVLIWQINDCWPAISWSLVDYWHNPKAGYYYVRRAFSPLLLSLVHQEQHVQIWLVNDTSKSVSGTIRLTLFDFDGTPLHSKDVPASAPPHSSTLVGTKSLQEMGFLDATRHFIHARFAERGRSLVETTLLPSRFREIKFPHAHVAWEVKKVGQQTFEVELRSKTFAKAVCVEAKAAMDYSDNFADLVPSAKKSIVVRTKRDMELEEFKAGLKVSDGIF
jgi:beta-mannosidase